MIPMQRRRFLKAGVTLAAATAATLLPGCGLMGRTKTLHISVADGRGLPGDEYTLHIDRQKIAIQSHTPESLTRLAASQAQLVGNLGGRFALTHYAEGIELPDRAIRTHITRRRLGAPKGTHELVAVRIHAPISADQLAVHMDELSQLRQTLGFPIKVQSAVSGASLYGEVICPVDTAASIVFHHPEIMAFDDAVRTRVLAHIYSAQGFGSLWREIGMRPGTTGDEESWCEMVEVINDETGLPYVDDEGNLIYDYRTAEDVMELAGEVIREVLITLNNDPALEDKVWKVRPGVANQPTEIARAGLQGSSAYNVVTDVAATAMQSGAWISPSLYSEGNRSIRILGFNVFMRYLGVYVTFYDSNDEPMQLSDKDWDQALQGAMFNSLKSVLEPIGLTNSTMRAAQFLSPPATLVGVPVAPGNTEFFVRMPEGAKYCRISCGGLGMGSFLAAFTHEGKPIDNILSDIANFRQQIIGLSLTAMINIIVPTYCLVTATGFTETKSLIELLKKNPGTVVNIVSTIANSVLSLITVISNSSSAESKEAALVALGRGIGRLLLDFGSMALKILFNPKVGEILAWTTAQIGVVNAVSAAPFVGWAFRAAAMTSSTLQLMQTVSAVSLSRASMHWKIHTELKAQLTFHPDLENVRFPENATWYEFVVTGPGLTTFKSGRKDLDRSQDLDRITVTVDRLMAGGVGRFSVMFYNDQDTLVGRGEAAVYKLTDAALQLLQTQGQVPASLLTVIRNTLINRNFSDTPSLTAALKGVLVVTDYDKYLRPLLAAFAQNDIALLVTQGKQVLELECTIEQVLAPLTINTRYQHDRLLQYEGGRYKWLNTRTPPQAFAPTCSDNGLALCELPSITLSRRTFDLGYAWRSSSLGLPVCGKGASNSQAYAVQNISLGVDPNVNRKTLTLNGTACGVAEGAGVYYQFDGPSDGSGANFLLDGRNTDGRSVRVRPIRLSDPNAFELAGKNLNYGSFSEVPTSLCWHRAGYLIGVNRARHKMEILDLNAGLFEDRFTPPAKIAAGLGNRFGLLNGPSCIAARLDGTLLVLESVTHKIQAFDVDGNPVMLFDGTPRFNLVDSGQGDSMTYLDMSVEARGYVYVLSYRGDGSQAGQYKLDIYTPEGLHLNTTTGFTAARMIVDYWRNVVTLNWMPLFGVNGRTEPTISSWSAYEK